MTSHRTVSDYRKDGGLKVVFFDHDPWYSSLSMIICDANIQLSALNCITESLI